MTTSFLALMISVASAAPRTYETSKPVLSVLQDLRRECGVRLSFEESKRLDPDLMAPPNVPDVGARVLQPRTFDFDFSCEGTRLEIAERLVAAWNSQLSTREHYCIRQVQEDRLAVAMCRVRPREGAWAPAPAILDAPINLPGGLYSSMELAGQTLPRALATANGVEVVFNLTDNGPWPHRVRIPEGLATVREVLERMLMFSKYSYSVFATDARGAFLITLHDPSRD